MLGISESRIKHIQDVVGTFAWYGQAVDRTIKPGRRSKTILKYCATHPNAGVRFHASDMILAMNSEGSYLSKIESKSRAAGHFYFSKLNNKKFNNGAVVTISKIINM